MRKFLLVLLAVALFGCDPANEEKPAAQAGKSAPQAGQPVTRPATASAIQKQTIDPDSIMHADRVVAFSNAAVRYLEQGYYSQADILHKNAQRYTRTFQLPGRPNKGKRDSGLLKPAPGLFTDTVAEDMAAGLRGMDKALDQILADYAELEKYVADDNLRDNGKRGTELVAKIGASHESFARARREWLASVRKGAREAEQLLLHEHPLRRQILAGHAIFSEIEKAEKSLADGQSDRQLLAACGRNLGNEISTGAKPPFPGKPGLERLYREFLKKAADYGQKLRAVISEGVHDAQIRELLSAHRETMAAWNEFASALNANHD